MTSQPTQRIAAIDVMRALTMFLMLFVNDIPALKGIPHWQGHAEWDEDMLGFADTIFPAFLFCVGMSIPFAIGGRLRHGESQFSTLVHILLRSLALIVMGIFTMSAEEGGGIVGYHLFSYLSVIAFFLVWIDYRSWKAAPWLHCVLRGLGITLLAGLVVWRDIQSTETQCTPAGGAFSDLSGGHTFSARSSTSLLAAALFPASWRGPR